MKVYRTVRSGCLFNCDKSMGVLWLWCLAWCALNEVWVLIIAHFCPPLLIYLFHSWLAKAQKHSFTYEMRFILSLQCPVLLEKKVFLWLKNLLDNQIQSMVKYHCSLVWLEWISQSHHAWDCCVTGVLTVLVVNRQSVQLDTQSVGSGNDLDLRWREECQK